MDNNKYINYLDDCLGELLKRLEEARDDANKSNSEFDQGRWLGYYEAVTLLMSQTEAFQIKSTLKKSIREYQTGF